MLKSESDAIKICRILCIFMMTFVHINPGQLSWQSPIPPSLYWVSYFLADILGRASVPALSVISGYLALAAYTRKGSWLHLIKNKITALAIPLVTWNMLIIVFAFAIFYLTGKQTSQMKELVSDQHDFLAMLDNLTAYNYGSITEPLNFLRDIFVCSILFPLIYFMIAKFRAWMLFAVCLLGLTYGFDPVVIRPSIFMFFTIGVYLAYVNKSLILSVSSAIKLFVPISSAALVVFITPVFNEFAGGVRYHAFIFAISASFVAISLLLARLNIGKKLTWFNFLCFPLFLSHILIMTFFWGIWQVIFGTAQTWPYLVFYLAMPFAALIGVLLLYKTTTKMPRVVQKILWGK